MDAVYLTFATRALSETSKFWSVHKNWVYLAGPATALALRVAHGGGMKLLLTEWASTATTLVIGFAVAWVGTLLINLIRAPILVGRDHRKEIGNLRSAVRQLALKYDSRPKPRVILEYLHAPHADRFILANRGNADATNIAVSNLINNGKYLRWRVVDHIRHGHDAEVEILTIWEPKSKEELDGSRYLGALSHRSALEWLIEHSPELSEATYESEVEVTFDDETGRPADPVSLIIYFDSVSKEVSIFPKQPATSPDSSTPQSPESATHAD
jgi:hypothetical protein